MIAAMLGLLLEGSINSKPAVLVFQELVVAHPIQHQEVLCEPNNHNDDDELLNKARRPKQSRRPR